MSRIPTSQDAPSNKDVMRDAVRDHPCIFMSHRSHGIWNDLGWAVIAIFTLCAVLVAAEY